MAASRSDSFTRSSFASRMTVRPRAWVAIDHQDRQLVDEPRDDRPADLGAAQLAARAPSRRRAARPRPRARPSTRDVRAHRPEHVEEPGARRVHAEAPHRHLRAGQRRGGAQEEGRRGDVARARPPRPPARPRGAHRRPSSPSTRTGTPMPASIRSVWSRERSGSRHARSRRRRRARRAGSRSSPGRSPPRARGACRGARRPARRAAAAGRRRAPRGSRPCGGAAR